MSEQSAPIELLDHVLAKPGFLLVQRLENLGRSGMILLPWSATEMKRAAEAVVHDSGVPEYQEGDLVVLTGTVARFLTFGEHAEKVTLWSCTPEQVLFRLTKEAEKAIAVGEDHFQKHITSEDYEKEDLEGWAEGEKPLSPPP